jgi:hypothetical protein
MAPHEWVNSTEGSLGIGKGYSGLGRSSSTASTTGASPTPTSRGTGWGGYDAEGNPDPKLVKPWNDPWKFDSTTLEWTWVSDSTSSGELGIYGARGIEDPMNFPGARESAVSWIDSLGRSWLFGGFVMGASSHGWNDLWRYTR